MAVNFGDKIGLKPAEPDADASTAAPWTRASSCAPSEAGDDIGSVAELHELKSRNQLFDVQGKIGKLFAKVHKPGSDGRRTCTSFFTAVVVTALALVANRSVETEPGRWVESSKPAAYVLRHEL